MTPVQLNGVASTALVVFFVISSLTLVGLLAAAAYLIWKLNTLIESYRSRLDPLLDKVETTLALATDKVTSISDKTERILVQGEQTATLVQQRVDSTTAVVQRTVNGPVIGLNSLLSGVTQGWNTFRRLQGRAATKDAQALFLAGDQSASGSRNRAVTETTQVADSMVESSARPAMRD